MLTVTMNPPKPMIVHVLHRLHYAGAEVLAAGLARQLRERYQFSFLCLDGIGPLGTTLRGEGFIVEELHRQPGVDLGVGKRMRAQYQPWQKNAPLLLHAHQCTPMFYAAVSRGLWGKLIGSPRILFTEHGRHYPDVRKLKRVIANQLLLGRRDRVTAVGQFVADALAKNEGIARSKIQVIHNGIETAKFELGENRQAMCQEMRAKLNLSDDAIVALQVARFHPVKDHATALRAWAKVVHHSDQNNAKKAVLLLAGDGEERENLHALAQSLDIKCFVKFLGVRTDIPQLMAASDLFCLSSVSEGLSVTLLEAMASGLPIAATDVGGNRETVGDADDATNGPDSFAAGLLSPRGDAEQLGTQLLRLINDTQLRQTLAIAGKKRVHLHFTQMQMHDAFSKIYDTMLGISRND